MSDVTQTTSEEWRDWSCDVSVVVGGGADAARAAEIVRDVMAAVDRAASRFRADSELSELAAELPGGAMVSETLSELMRAALVAADLTDGDVDPTLGYDLAALGYDRDFSTIPTEGSGTVVTVLRSRLPGWTRVRLDGRRLTVPADIRLDLGAAGKAFAVDRAAAEVARALDCPVLVNIGGDLATAGPALAGGWQIAVQDLPSDPRQQVTLASGSAMATSSTQKRRWSQSGVMQHHLLDPRSGLPAEPVWRSVTVAARDCLHSNAYSSGAIIRGHSAIDWLNRLGVDARLVDGLGRVVTTASWPTPVEDAGREAVRYE